MSSTKKSSAPKKHRRGKVRTVTINPAADDGLGVNIIANKAGYVEVAKCHHHSKCKGLKGYCIVAVNQQSFGSGSLVRFSHLSSSLVVYRRLSSSLVVSRRLSSPWHNFRRLRSLVSRLRSLVSCLWWSLVFSSLVSLA